MSIGYACIIEGVNNIRYKTVKLSNLNDDKLREIISHNLNTLEKAIDYNISKNIKLYRITSELIPFASTDYVTINWEEEYRDYFKKIGDKIKKHNIKVSLHPGQYSVLNSFNEKVVNSAIRDLEYHTKVLDLLGLDFSFKMVLHIGGIYFDKELAIKNFIKNFELLSTNAKRRLIIENDDKSFNILDLLRISSEINIPVVYDNLHNSINSIDDSITDFEWIKLCSKTWKKDDGRQKVHYSIQAPNKKIGSHSETIYIEQFLEYYNSLDNLDIDIMLEVKDKNISALKCINATRKNKDIRYLEEEWSLFKLYILQKSYKKYKKISKLLTEKSKYPVIKFYAMIEECYSLKVNKKSCIRSIEEVWKQIKDYALDNEKINFEKKFIKYKKNEISLKAMKNYLLSLSLKYNIDNLITSYYFYF